MSVAADRDRRGDIPVPVVVAVTILIVAVLGAVVYLTAIGRDISNVLIILSSLIAPTVASFVAIRKLDDVRQKVNGKVDNLISDKSSLEQQVTAAGMIPVTAKVAFDPETNTGPIPRVTDATDTNAYGIPIVHAADLIRREHPDYRERG